MNKEVVGYRTIPTISGHKNIYYDRNLSEEFTKKMYSIALRVTKAEALDLPETISSYRYARLESKARKLYDGMEKEAIIDFGTEKGKVVAPLILTKMLRLQQICGGFLKPSEAEEYTQVSTSKLETLKEILEETEGKIVIFAKFIPEIEAIQQIAIDLGINPRVLTGSTNPKAREARIKDFQENPQTKLFITQIQTGGVGITLTAASTAIFFSTGYSLIDYEQAKARIHRIGQTEKVNYIHILAENTIDEEIIKALDKKMDIATMSVDNLRKLINGEGIEVSRLPREIEQVLEKQPQSSERFDSNIKDLLNEIEVDLKKYGKMEGDKMFENPLTDEERDDFLRRDRERRRLEEEAKSRRKSHKESKWIEREESGEVKEKTREDRPERVSKKVEKTSSRIITLKELGEELDMEPREMRKWLRKNSTIPEGGRWEWNSNSPELEKIRKTISVKH